MRLLHLVCILLYLGAQVSTELGRRTDEVSLAAFLSIAVNI